MRIETRPSREDFLAFHLYTSSQSARSRRRRYVSWIVGTIFLASIGATGYAIAGVLPATSIVIPAVLFLGYPFYSDLRYRRHFSRHIDEYYGDRIGRTSSLEVRDGKLIAESEGARAEIEVTRIKGVVQTKEHFFVYLEKAAAVILPTASEEVAQFVTLLEERSGKERTDMTAWRWWFFARRGPTPGDEAPETEA